MTPIRVRRAGFDDVAIVSGILAAAFYDDPVFRWCFPDDDRRRTIAQAFFRVNLERVWIAKGLVEVAGNGAAAAIWIPPGGNILTEKEEGELDAANARVLAEFAPRVNISSAIMMEDRPTESHHYGAYAGVVPEQQGRGFGTLLIQRGLERIDRDSLGTYLDASAFRNRSLYERHGFSVIREHHLPDGPAVWGMWRPPDAARK